MLLLINVSKSEIHAVVLIEDVIQASGEIRNGLRNRIDVCDVGVDQRIIGSLWQWRGGIHRLGQRADSIDGNLVVGKRRALQSTGLGGVWIVNDLLDASAIDQSAEVAISHGHCRHSYQLVGGLTQREALIREEEERPVSAIINLWDKDGATD